MNQVLLGLNILLGAFALAIWKSPRAKRWLGYRLQASARADEVRQQHYRQLVAEFEEATN